MAYYNYDCCRDCKPPKRQPACQDTCPDKKKIAELNKALENKIKEEKLIDSCVVELTIERNKRWKDG